MFSLYLGAIYNPFISENLDTLNSFSAKRSRIKKKNRKPAHVNNCTQDSAGEDFNNNLLS
jgi:hypothetical protein